MPSFSSVDWTEDGLGNPIKMHANKELITGVLKGRMGFDGFVISDWDGDPPASPGDRRRAASARPSTRASTCHGSSTCSMRALELRGLRDHAAARRSTPAASRWRASTTRSAASSPRSSSSGCSSIPTPTAATSTRSARAQHRTVARQAVAKSQVLLKNQRGALPLRTRPTLYVAGSNADNIGNQAGGWTLTWQGGSTNQIPGDTILRGDPAGVQAAASPTARTPPPRSTSTRRGVVVVGETPYAEGFGDVGGPQWGFDPGDNGVLRPPQTMQLNDNDKAAIDKVCAEAAKCVVVVVSGRPLIIDPAQLPEIDGLVAAWLPGQRGRGRGRPAVRPRALHGQAAGDVAAHARPGADQRRRRRLRPAVSPSATG